MHLENKPSFHPSAAPGKETMGNCCLLQAGTIPYTTHLPLPVPLLPTSFLLFIIIIEIESRKELGG